MSVRFIIGRAGTGKTHHCIASILRARQADPLGPPIFWILPKQATFTAERWLVTAAGAHGFAGVWVISFDELATEILTECGGAGTPLISPLARQMLLGRLLRAHAGELRYFASVARQSGLAKSLDATFDEFERSDRSASDLAEIIRSLDLTDAPELEHSSLGEKLHDLHLLYASYEAYLGQEKLDPRRRVAQMLGCIDRSTLLRHARVFVDGFLDYSDTDRRILAVLGRICQSVEITARFDPSSAILTKLDAPVDELSVFHRTQRAYRRVVRTLIEARVILDPPMLLRDVRRPKFESLASIERSMAGESVNACGADGSVHFYEASDARGEVEMAARVVQEYIGAGNRLRDVLILTRSLDHYHDLMTAVFNEHDIPFFADRRRSAAHHALARLVRCLVRVMGGNWPHDAVIELVKTGLAGLTLDEGEALEAYVLSHRIRGATWARNEPWKFERSDRDEDAPEASSDHTVSNRADALRRKLIAPIMPVLADFQASPSQPIKQIVRTLLRVLESLGARATLSNWIDIATTNLQHEEAEEHQQAWTKTVELFDQMVDVLGDESVTLLDFAEILETGFESFDLALVPPTVDQVLAGEIERLRMTSSKLCIVLGLSEGIFPRRVEGGTVFNDGDRRMLGRLNVEIDPDGARRTLDETILGYFAFTRASERLCLIRPTADRRGHALQPSPFWEQARSIVPDAPVSTIERKADVSTIATPRQLVETLLRYRTRSGFPDTTDAQVQTFAALDALVRHAPPGAGGLREVYDRAVLSLQYRNRATLSPDLAGALFAPPLSATAKQLETFAACPFAHFAAFGLSLTDRPEADLSPRDLSIAYHDVLGSLVSKVVADRQDLQNLPPDQLQDVTRRIVRQASHALQARLALSDARRHQVLTEIQRTVNAFVASQALTLNQARLRPAHTQLRFGNGQRVPSLDITSPLGHVLRISGTIDRVDVVAESFEFAVMDYTLRGSTLSLQEVYYGISLRLLTYLLVLQSNGQSLGGQAMTPVAGFYLGVMRRIESILHPSLANSPDDPLFALYARPRGILSGESLHLFDPGLREGHSDFVQVYISKSGQPGYMDKSDYAEARAFGALLAHVHDTLGKLTDRIVAGEIEARPYRLGQVSPCPSCAYRGVCRFETSYNRYLRLDPMNRQDVFDRVAGTGGRDDA